MGDRPQAGGPPSADEVAEGLLGLPASGIDWPSVTRAVLGRVGTRAEVVGRVAELLEESGRLGREVARCHRMIDIMDMRRF